MEVKSDRGISCRHVFASFWNICDNINIICYMFYVLYNMLFHMCDRGPKRLFGHTGALTYGCTMYYSSTRQPEMNSFTTWSLSNMFQTGFSKANLNTLTCLHWLTECRVMKSTSYGKMGSGNRSSPRSVALSQRSKSPSGPGRNYMRLCLCKRPAERFPVHVDSVSPIQRMLCVDWTSYKKDN